MAAAIASLPKQLGTVSAGGSSRYSPPSGMQVTKHGLSTALLASSENGGKANKLPSYILFALTVVATIFAQRYMRKKIDEHRLVVVREKRRVRAAVADASASDVLGEGARETGSKRGKDGQRRGIQKFWRKMSTGELSHVW